MGGEVEQNIVGVLKANETIAPWKEFSKKNKTPQRRKTGCRSTRKEHLETRTPFEKQTHTTKHNKPIT